MTILNTPKQYPFTLTTTYTKYPSIKLPSLPSHLYNLNITPLLRQDKLDLQEWKKTSNNPNLYFAIPQYILKRFPLQLLGFSLNSWRTNLYQTKKTLNPEIEPLTPERKNVA